MKLDGPIWIGSYSDIRIGDRASDALQYVNDAKYVTKDGITQVPLKRWQQAQKFEKELWCDHLPYAKTDRHNEHMVGFDKYIHVPKDLGSVIEVGCGPFTQLQWILSCGHDCTSIALLDPLAASYLSHPNCTYRDRTLSGKPVVIYPHALETMKSDGIFDTAICINVLEHVYDAKKCMTNIVDMLKPNGVLVFHEQTWDNIDLHNVYDVGHPIRIKSSMANDLLLSNFDALYQSSSTGDLGVEIYYVGRKK